MVPSGLCGPAQATVLKDSIDAGLLQAFRKYTSSLKEFHVKEDSKSSRNTTCLSSLGRLHAAWENPRKGSLPLGRVHIPQGPGPKALSAGTDTADRGPSWAHEAQLLLLIDAQLVTAAPGPGSRWDPVVSLGTRGQQEAHTASDEHMPNAVNVEVVVSCLHKSIE